jgi:glycosyltransferase involved in cell wall biosynthesis
VHVIGTLAAGGAERFVVDLVCELRRRGLDARLVVLGRRTDRAGEQMARELAQHAVPTFVGPTEEIRLRAVWWYVRLMARERPDIVHLHNLNTETAQMFVPPHLQPRRGLLRTVHSVSLDLREMEGFSFRRNRVRCTIFCSKASLERNRELIRGEARIIQNGMKFGWPVRTVERSAEAKRSLGLDPVLLHFLHVGRMTGLSAASSPKAHDTLLRAWREARLGERRARLHLLGDGDLRPPLEKLAAGDASVAFHGVRPDVPSWLLAADCFVMPSRWEGLPIAGIEAVATGLPCLFSRIAPLEELEAPAARWCEVDDVAGLARILREAADRPPIVPAEAIEPVRQRFTIERAAAEYVAAYA